MIQPAQRPIPSRIGIGLRPPHIAEILETRPAIGWFEVHAENYFGGGPALARLEAIRNEYPLSLHGVGLSLGSAEGICRNHLARLKDLALRTEPFLVSEHLSWSVTGGVYLNDLLPLPYTEETLDLFARNILAAQEALGREILIENPSCYLGFRHSTIPEPEFLDALVRRTGCLLLCDVNNIFVTCRNLGLDPDAYLDAIPAQAVREIHLAGHSRVIRDGKPVLIDTHSTRVDPAVWALYRRALSRFGLVPSLIEWDKDLPPLGILLDEAATAAMFHPPAEATMPMLHELQASFRRALLEGDTAAIGQFVQEDEGPERFAIHRNNVLISLTDVLAETFPAVRRVVDERFFAYAAHEFITRHPPERACLSEYGGAFPDFLAGFPPCAGLPYLPDLARFEWLMTVAAHAADAAPADPGWLDMVPPEATPRLLLQLHPSCGFLASPWPIDRIWRANRPSATAEETIDLDDIHLDAGGVRLEVSRQAGDVVYRLLDEPSFAFREALGKGASLQEAAEASLAADADFDIAEAFATLFREGVVTAFLSQPVAQG